MGGVVGAMRIGDVALGTVHGDLRVQAAAPADLHHVAELHRGRGRLADDAEVGGWWLAAIHSRPRTVPSTAGPSSSPVISRLIEPLGAPGRKVLRGGGNKRRDAAFHVAGGAAVQHAVPHLGAEGSVVCHCAAPTGTTSVCPAKDRYAAHRFQCGRTGCRSRHSATGVYRRSPTASRQHRSAQSAHRHRRV